MKILIGTKNPGKIEGAREAFEKYFDNVEIEGISVNSEVGDQPINKEILKGAKNRVKNLKKYAKENQIKADFYISSEAGITNLLGEWIDINAVVIEDSKGLQSIGTSQGTKDEVTRIDLTRNAFIMALTKYINDDLWK